MTFVDAVITFVVVVIVAAGVIELFAMALSPKAAASKPAQTALFARQKLEQLLTLCGGNLSAAQNAKRIEPFNVPGCTGRAVAKRMPVPGGSLDTHNPAEQYVDYLDARGNVVSPTAHWEYVRVWEISVPAHGSRSSKEIAVKTQARQIASNGVAPEFTIVTTRAFPLQ